MTGEGCAPTLARRPLTLERRVTEELVGRRLCVDAVAAAPSSTSSLAASVVIEARRALPFTGLPFSCASPSSSSLWFVSLWRARRPRLKGCEARRPTIRQRPTETLVSGDSRGAEAYSSVRGVDAEATGAAAVVLVVFAGSVVFPSPVALAVGFTTAVGVAVVDVMAEVPSGGAVELLLLRAAFAYDGAIVCEPSLSASSVGGAPWHAAAAASAATAVAGAGAADTVVAETDVDVAHDGVALPLLCACAATAAAAAAVRGGLLARGELLFAITGGLAGEAVAVDALRSALSPRGDEERAER